MKEYGILQRCKSAKPYMIHFYDNIESAKMKIYDLVALQEERGNFYYVDNDFFNNKYPFNFNGMYYCIKEREVTEFKNYCEDKIMKKYDNNIYYYNNYKTLNNF